MGLLALLDNPKGDLRDGIFAAGFAIYPLAESFFVIAPGYELQEGNEPEPLIRLGVGYNIPIGKSAFTIAPALNFDFVGDELVWVYGLNFEVERGRYAVGTVGCRPVLTR